MGLIAKNDLHGITLNTYGHCNVKAALLTSGPGPGASLCRLWSYFAPMQEDMLPTPDHVSEMLRFDACAL
jgi:hypothetical protein